MRTWHTQAQRINIVCVDDRYVLDFEADHQAHRLLEAIVDAKREDVPVIHLHAGIELRGGDT